MAIKIVALASGNGSNFESLVRHLKKHPELNAEITHLICNKANAQCLDRAKALGIPSTVLRRFETRAAYDKALLEHLVSLAPDFIVLAGYMRILDATTVKQFPMRILNIHPSLLPAFPGLEGLKQAYEYGVTIYGATVHFVSEQMDEGPIILQDALVCPKQDWEFIENQMKSLEHRLYFNALKRVLTQKFTLVGRRLQWI